MDNWEDLNNNIIVPVSDDTLYLASDAIGAPRVSGNMAKSGFDVSGMPYLTVSNNPTAGQYSDIQEAINALQNSRYEGIYIMNGTYTLAKPVYIPNINMRIFGESQGGTIIENTDGYEAFYIDGYTGTLTIENFTINSKNAYAYLEASKAIIYETDGSGKIFISNLVLNLTCHISRDNGDIAVWSTLSDSDITIDGFTMSGDGTLKVGGYRCVYGTVVGNITITNCKINYVNGGIDLDTCKKVFVSNVHITNFNESAILIWNCVSTQIIGCYMKSILYSLRDFDAIRCFTGGKVTITNNTIDIVGNSPGWHWGMDIGDFTKGVINGNTIVIDCNNTSDGVGIYFDGEGDAVDDCIITSNTISVRNRNAGGAAYGIILAYAERNIINNNRLTGYTAGGTCIGIYLSNDSDNNQGTSNITYDFDTSISDNGAGNTVTAKDV